MALRATKLIPIWAKAARGKIYLLRKYFRAGIRKLLLLAKRRSFISFTNKLVSSALLTI